MESKEYQIIINPASAGGKTNRKKEVITGLLHNHFGNEFNLYETSYKGHARQITNFLCSKGYNNFIAVGGDGTIQECVNGLFSNGRLINPQTRVGIISSGTGQGFARSIGLPQDIEYQIILIKKGNTRLTDLGIIKFGTNGFYREIIFINEFQAGIGCAVVQSVQGKRKQMGGTIAYGIEALVQTLTLPNRQMKICTANDVIDTRILGIVVANGAFTGGSMNLVPDADPRDNKLNLLIMHAQGKLRRLRSFSKIYSGKHLESEYFETKKINSLSISSEIDTLTEADGEVLDHLPCTVQILPSALKIFSN